MKLNYRIILINFLIFAFLITGAGFAFYSILHNVLTAQEAKRLRDAANDFVIEFETINKGCEESFKELLSGSFNKQGKIVINREPNNIDFVLLLPSGNNPKTNTILYKGRFIRSPKGEFTLKDFYVLNQNLIVKSYKTKSGDEYLYGYSLERELFQGLSSRMRIDFAFYFDFDRVFMTNQAQHDSYLPILDDAYRQLFTKNNFEVFSSETENLFVLATIFHVKEATANSKSASILLFSKVREVGNLVGTLRLLLAIIAVASLLLSVILNFVFTARIRQQINSITKATGIAKTGNFQSRIHITTNDEIGQLAAAFNIMLNELDVQERIKQDYTEFITQINFSTDFKKISNDSLQRIIKSTDYSIGAIYLVNGDKIELAATEGLDPNHQVFSAKNDLLYAVLNRNQNIDLKFSSGAPAISAGLVSIQLTEMVLMPVSSGDNIIAILQVASVDPVSIESKQYIEKIMAQLAIALNKALVYKRLQELVGELEIQKLKAEESTEMKSKFLAVMSHELRTPLNSILGLAQLLSEDQTLTPRNRERLQVLMISGNRLLQMINDVLDLSKIEAGKMDVRLENFYLYELMDELLTAFQPITVGKGLELHQSFLLPENIYLQTDKTKVYQIINNLLSNAVKFTPSGYVEITTQMEAGDILVFSISDTGIGITEDDLPYIFDEFRQADSSSTRKYGGSGLGLSISKKFVDLLGGTLEAQSRKKQGTTFIVKIPVTVLIEKSKLQTFSLPLQSTVYTLPETDVLLSPRDEATVLIVDDDPGSLFTLNEIVKECGCKTIIAKTGDECLEILNSVVPNIILMDLMMPGKDGIETTREIRRKPEWTDIPIIAVSARALMEDQEQISGLGFTGIVPKPVNSANLAFKITRLIQDSTVKNAKNTNS